MRVLKFKQVFKRLIALLACAAIIATVSPTQSSAHTVTNQGSESSGWVHGTHALSSTQKYFYVAGTDQFWKDRFNSGDSYMYSQSGYHLNMVNDSAWNTNNYVEAQNVSSATWVARTVYNVSGQHKTTWWIQFNSKYQGSYSTSQWNYIAEHEIGHVFGLKDLYESYNNYRLMWWQAGNYSGLTSAEKTGLSIIWGY